MDTRQILLEIYSTLGGQYWKQDQNWNTPTPLSTWHGVVVDDNNALLELNLEENNLEGTLPSCITLCSKLKRLNLRGNKLTGPLPDAIGRCAALKDLGLSRNILTGTIPESIGQCANLEYLGLSNNRLIDNIPESLGRCIKLREVSLGHNKLTGSIPESLGRCVGLTTLSLSDNRLTGELPECLEKWVNLQKLLLDNNQFNGPLPNSIGKCVNLRQLSIADNELSGFFPEALGKCVNLKRLNLSGNSISGRIPDSFGACNQLDHLYLLGNRLVGYEIIRKLHRLKILDIDLVTLLDLPNELNGRELQIILSYIRELYLTSTPLSDSHDDTTTLLMKRIKIILIGPGEAGKTTLLHRLIHNKFEGGYGMTDGINMSELVLNDLKISFWDFSGQNIYMNTHLLFYSPAVLYLVIWNPRQHDHHSYITIYLNMIRNYAPMSPIILITTHAKDTSKLTEYSLKILENQFSHTATHPNYGPICCYHHVDSLTGVGIQELKKDLLKYSLDQPWVIQRVPKIFKKLEIGLKEMGTHGRFSLTRNEYLKYCYEVFKIDEESAGNALELFHNWGIVHMLSLGDIIIEPQKLALVMSSAISYKAEIIYRMGDGKLGLLRHDEIDLVWKDFDESLRSQFLQMFHDYKLAYPLYDSKGQSLSASIVPAMLPDEPLGGNFSPTEDDLKQLYFPQNCQKQASIHLECDYLPIPLIPKLQVRLSLLATLGGAWKYGCSLQLDSYHRHSEYTCTQSYAIIQSNPFLHTIDIYSGGDTTCARSLAIKCLLELQMELFSTMKFLDVKVYYNSEPIAANKLIKRKLKRDLYSYLIYEGDEESVALPLRGLAFLFPECYPTRLRCELTEEERKEEEYLMKNKIQLIHEEMINMSKSGNPMMTMTGTGMGIGGTGNSKEIGNGTDGSVVNPSSVISTGGGGGGTAPGSTTTAGTAGGGVELINNEQLTIPIIDLLIKKKKLQKQHSNQTGKTMKLERPKSSSRSHGLTSDRKGLKSLKSMASSDYIDYRQVMPSKLLTLQQMALQVLSNPNTLEELIELESFFLDCYPEILLYGCNIPCELFEIHTLWIACDNGKFILPLTPPEKPTNSWKPVINCLLSLPLTRVERSTLPGINKQISDIILIVIKALGIECPAISNSQTFISASTIGSASVVPNSGLRRGNGSLNPQFMISSTWSGLIDMSPYVDLIKNIELKYFISIENCLGKVMWVERDVANRMHAPNMSVSDQVFRELFKGTRGANPHAALLRDAVDNIIPISLGILPRYDFFISHSFTSHDLTTATLLRDYLQSRGYSVWIDFKKKTGINKGMLAAIDSSSYILLLLSSEYIQQIHAMELQQNDIYNEEIKEYTSYFQFIYSLKRKNTCRILPIMLEEELMRGWDGIITEEMVINRYKLNQARERALLEGEGEGEEGEGGGEGDDPVGNQGNGEAHGDGDGEEEEEMEIHLDQQEYETIRIQLLCEYQASCGWIGQIGKYLFEYLTNCEKKPSNEMKMKFFLSNQLITQLENEIEEKRRRGVEEKMLQQRLLQEQQGKRKKKNEKKGLRGESGEDFLTSIGREKGKSKMESEGINDGNRLEKNGIIAGENGDRGGKQTDGGGEGGEAVEGGEGGEDETAAAAGDGLTTGGGHVDPSIIQKEKQKKILENIQNNELFQQLIQCAYQMAIQSHSIAKNQHQQQPFQPSNQPSSPLHLSILSQLHGTHRLLTDLIEQPVGQQLDLWLDDTLLNEEQRRSLNLNKSHNQEGNALDKEEREEGGRDEERDQLNTPPLSPPQTSPSIPSSPLPTRSIPLTPAPVPFSLLSSFPQQSTPPSTSSYTASSISMTPLSNTAFHPLMPLNSDYHLKYKFLHTLTSSEVTQLFKSLSLSKYLHIITDNEVTGMTLQHCLTIEDLKSIGITSDLKCREFLTYLTQMKLSGVPIQFILN